MRAIDDIIIETVLSEVHVWLEGAEQESLKGVVVHFRHVGVVKHHKVVDVVEGKIAVLACRAVLHFRGAVAGHFDALLVDMLRCRNG